MAVMSMWFDVTIVDAENDFAEHRIVTTAGDYTRLVRWAAKNLQPTANEACDNLQRNFGLIWFALERQGRLGEFGIPDKLDEAAITAMQDRFGVSEFEELSTDKAPLPLGLE